MNKLSVLTPCTHLLIDRDDIGQADVEIGVFVEPFGLAVVHALHEAVAMDLPLPGHVALQHFEAVVLSVAAVNDDGPPRLNGDVALFGEYSFLKRE